MIQIPRGAFILFLFTILLSLSCIFVLLLSSCTAQPYWDQDAPPTAAHSPSALPIATDGWREYAVVGTVNIRKEPSTSSEVIGALYAGAVVLADCDRSDGFCEVPGGFVVEGCLGIGDGKCSAK